MEMLDEIKSLGSSNVANMMMAYQTYLELTRVEHYNDVHCRYDSELDIIYVEGTKNDVQSIFVPVHSSFTMSLTWIRAAQSKLGRNEQKSIVLVIRDADSSSVRYKLSEGLIPPSNESNRVLRKGGEKSKKKQKVADTIAVEENV